MKKRFISLVTAVIMIVCALSGPCLDVSAGTGKTKFDLTDFIKNASKPVGSTLYVWGGGWNKADNAAGTGALKVGVYKKWKTYYKSHRAGYSYKPGKEGWLRGERKWRLYGLDCSGYVGWSVYNGVSSGRRKAGYVFSSTVLAQNLADLGYGKAVSCTTASKFKPGDIISLKGHVIIVLGTCSDGSVLIMHSTPNGGVQVSGTYGAHGDKAVGLAKKYMKSHYPDWYSHFKSEKTYSKPESSYLRGTRFRFKSSKYFTDSAGVRKMTGEQALKLIQ